LEDFTRPLAANLLKQGQKDQIGGNVANFQ
jgi:hypothetical protein